MQPRQVGRQFADCVQRRMGLRHRVRQGVQGHLPACAVNAIGSHVVPAPFAMRQFSGHQAPVAGALFDLLADLGPFGQAARVLQAACQQVAAEFKKMPGAELFAQKLHANGVELVRFVKHHGVHAGQ